MANIQSLTNDYNTFIFILLLFIRNIMMTISVTCGTMIGGPESPIIKRLCQVLTYYSCLLTFCFYELDVLVESDNLLLNLCSDQEMQIFNRPPINRTIDELSEEDAYAWTHIRKHQLRLLMVHL